jgi:hypothetical protein
VLAGDPLPPEVAGALGRRLAAAHAGSGPRADRALAPLGRAIASAATAADPARARGVAVEPGGGCVDDIDALLATLGAPVTRGGRGDGEMTVLRFHGGGWPEHRVGRLAPGAAIVEAPAGVDALWAPDEATRQACVAAGADPARVAVVPTPVDPGLFARQGPAVDLGEARSARFLAFADAPGWQAALRAFVQGFEPEADASLVLAAAGPAGLDQEAVVAAIVGVVEGELGRSIDAIPDVVLRPAPMAADERAGLYRAVDCVVGLPEGRREAIEAALCGRAVVEPGAMADAVSDAQRGAAVRAAALERHSPRLLRRHPAVLQALGEGG